MFLVRSHVPPTTFSARWCCPLIFHFQVKGLISLVMDSHNKLLYKWLWHLLFWKAAGVSVLTVPLYFYIMYMYMYIQCTPVLLLSPVTRPPAWTNLRVQNSALLVFTMAPQTLPWHCTAVALVSALLSTSTLWQLCVHVHVHCTYMHAQTCHM